MLDFRHGLPLGRSLTAPAQGATDEPTGDGPATGPATEPTAEPSPEPSPEQTDLLEEVAEVGEEIVERQECDPGAGTICSWVTEVTGSELVGRGVGAVVGPLTYAVAVVVVAIVVRWLVHRAINQFAAGFGGKTVRSRFDLFNDEEEQPDPISLKRRRQRADTIAALLRAVVTVVVWTLAAIVILSRVGVDTAPLVAVSGIIGVALAFGAQNLVSDFASGVFMIAEDQYGVGDVIDMGEATGVVEAVGLRVTRLRAVDGTVWHIRNGEVIRVGNMSQGWSRAVLDIGVGYGEDTTRSMEIIRRVALEMRRDAAYRDKFLDDPEVWGVEELAADQVTIRLIVKTVPLQQWVVARELRRRIKHEFDALGVEIPFPQRTVWVRTQGPGSEEAAEQLAGGEAGDEGDGAPAAVRSGTRRAPVPAGEERPDDAGQVEHAGHAAPPVAPPKGEADVQAEDTPHGTADTRRRSEPDTTDGLPRHE